MLTDTQRVNEFTSKIDKNSISYRSNAAVP